MYVGTLTIDEWVNSRNAMNIDNNKNWWTLSADNSWGGAMESWIYTTAEITTSSIPESHIYDQLSFRPVVILNNKARAVTNSDTTTLRKEICKLGFYIDNEILVKEKNIIYPVIRFKRGKKKYSYKDYLYGPVLIEKKDSLFIEYLTKEKITKEKLLEVMPKKYFEKRLQLKKELKIINNIL